MKIIRRNRTRTALLMSALWGLGVAHAAPPCQSMADKVAQEFAAERAMSSVDKTAKCRALYKVIADLTDLATACGADRPFIEATYKPLAKSVGDEAPKVCQR